MHVVNPNERGLRISVDFDLIDPFGKPSVFFQSASRENSTRQFLDWHQLEKLRDQLNEALGAYQNAKHLKQCEQQPVMTAAEHNAFAKGRW